MAAAELAPLLQWQAWAGGLGVVGVALLLGAALLPRLHGWSLPDRWLLRAVSGLVLTALAVLIIGQVDGLLFQFPWRVAGAVGWLFLVASWIKERRVQGSGSRVQGLRDGDGVSGKSSTRNPIPDPRSPIPFPLVGWVAVALWLLLMLGPAFSPPISYDVLEYHLGIVPHIFELGRVRPVPHIFYTAQPLGAEMLYTLAAVIEGGAWGHGPGVAHWALFVTATLVFVRLARALRLPAAWRPWLWLVVLTHPIPFGLQLDCFTDWTGALFGLTGVWICVRRGSRLRPLRTAALAGLLAGGAIGAKWTNVGTVAPALGLMVLALAVRRKTGGQGTRRLVACGLTTISIFCATALATLLPWLLWLGMVAGNPFAPFMAGAFPTEAWPPQRLDFLIQTHLPLSPLGAEYWKNLVSRLCWGLPGLPIITLAIVAAAGLMGWAWAAGHGRKVSGGIAASLGAWLTWRPWLVGWLLAGVAPGVLLWGQLRHGADRFLTPTLAISAVMLAVALHGAILIIRRKGPCRRGAILPVVVTASLVLVAASKAPFEALGVVEFGMVRHAAGGQNRYAFERESLGLTAELFARANRLPSGSRILAVNEARRYPFRHPIDLASVFDENPIRSHAAAATGAEDLRRRLVATGTTHLLVNEFEQARILGVHTPPRLLDDPTLKQLLADDDQAGLSRLYWGQTEFSTDPLPDPQREIYGRFLSAMRARAWWIRGAGPRQIPAMWIAPLAEPLGAQD